MILLDEVKYSVQAPATEDILEAVIKEHSQEIWGENSYYFEKKKLRTSAGVASIPDGYVVVFGNTPRWYYVVEIELASHQLFEHIVPQISKFAASLTNTTSLREITDAMHSTYRCR